MISTILIRERGAENSRKLFHDRDQGKNAGASRYMSRQNKGEVQTLEHQQRDATSDTMFSGLSALNSDKDERG